MLLGDDIMNKILCVEDSKEHREFVKAALAGSHIEFAQDLSSARKLLDNISNSYDILLLDVGLPDGNGIKFLSEFNTSLRKNRDIPIFIVSADNDELSKIAAFGLGIDDYISKPFSAMEFRARVEAKIKKNVANKTENRLILVGDIQIDHGKMNLRLESDAQVIDNITPIEFKIFVLLSQKPGNIMSRSQMIDRVWPANTFITERTVDAHVSHLRKKISESCVKIETVFNIGYKLVIESRDIK